MTEIEDKHKAAYDAMYEHTKNECGQCKIPYSCCDEFACRVTMECAKELYGVELTPLPKEDRLGPERKNALFLGKNGCVVPPHLRPLCTLHTCDINGLGFKPGEKEWTDQYFKLREVCTKADSDLYKERGM